MSRLAAACALVGLLLVAGPAHADGDEGRSFHALAATGIYGSLFGPTDWGPSVTVNILPGGVFDRYGLRGEWRGDEGYSGGLGMVGLVFEAGTARPQLALNLITDIGLTADGAPLIGGGVEGSLWALGPLGVTATTDAQLVIDGSDSSLAISMSLSAHLGF